MTFWICGFSSCDTGALWWTPSWILFICHWFVWLGWLTLALELEKYFSNRLFCTDSSILILVQIMTENVVPTPIWLVTSIWLPIKSMIRLQMLRPRPVPEWFIYSCSSSLPKSMNKFSRFSFEMPTPESSTSRANFTFYSRSSSLCPFISSISFI